MHQRLCAQGCCKVLEESLAKAVRALAEKEDEISQEKQRLKPSKKPQIKRVKELEAARGFGAKGGGKSGASASKEAKRQRDACPGDDPGAPEKASS